MTKTYLGLDIGSNSVKLAAIRRDTVQWLLSVPMPDNLVRDGHITSFDAMADELYSLLRKERITIRRAAVSLSPQATYVRRIVVPNMSAEQLSVNLPYEFHDYIQDDKDHYFYDYIVVGREEADDTDQLQLIAAAVPKALIADYRRMLAKAGLKLTVAVPECLAYRNLLRLREEAGESPKTCCIVDMGHSSIRIHMYRNSIYDTSHVVEYGGASIDALIAEEKSIDPHLAATYKMTDYEGVQKISACQDLYNRIAIEILRAINFYGFNTPGSDLQDIYIGGGMSRIPALMKTLASTLEIKIHSTEELLPPTLDGNGREYGTLCSAAIGAALETSWR
jgi:type IV pilus assembly protein PilM